MRTPRRLVAALFAGALAAGLAGCGGDAHDDRTSGFDWTASADRSKIAAQGVGFPTYGLADNWAGYGKVIKSFCAEHRATCEHTNTWMPAAEQIQKFDAEQHTPVGAAGDIGLLWGPIAEAKGVVPPYLPPSANKLKEWQRGKDGGWVATFAGSIAFVVNTEKVKHPPKSWADLLKPEYKGMIAFKDPRESGIGPYMVVAAAIANGGGVANPAPAYDFFARLQKAGNLSIADMSTTTLQTGEAPIQIDYDFNGIAERKRLKAKKIRVKVIIPSDGSIWGPSGLMINRFDTAKGDFLKSFLDYVLGDEAQIEFAKAGARPIRYLNGDLRLPEKAKEKWLPARSYARVREVDITMIDPRRIGRDWEVEVLAQAPPPPISDGSPASDPTALP